MRILVAWEDQYFQPLQRILKRCISLTRPDEATFPSVLCHTARGNSAFEPYVSRTWSLASRKGLPSSAGAIDHLICVADADKLHELIPEISSATPPTELGDWLHHAESLWERWLRSRCTTECERVHGRLLRWSKESVALAAYDQPAGQSHLRIDTSSDPLRTSLENCTPSPLTLDDTEFCCHYRKPMNCLQLLQPKLAKNSPEIDDTTSDFTQHGLDLLRVRVPDFDRIASFIWSLAAADTPPPSTTD